jgi:hypothetical protein
MFQQNRPRKVVGLNVLKIGARIRLMKYQLLKLDLLTSSLKRSVSVALHPLHPFYVQELAFLTIWLGGKGMLEEPVRRILDAA